MVRRHKPRLESDEPAAKKQKYGAIKQESVDMEDDLCSINSDDGLASTTQSDDKAAVAVATVAMIPNPYQPGYSVAEQHLPMIEDVNGKESKVEMAENHSLSDTGGLSMVGPAHSMAQHGPDFLIKRQITEEDRKTLPLSDEPNVNDLPNPYLSPPQSQVPSSPGSTIDTRSEKTAAASFASLTGEVDHAQTSGSSARSQRPKRHVAQRISTTPIINPYLTTPSPSYYVPKRKRLKKSRRTLPGLPTPAASTSTPFPLDEEDITEYATLSPQGLQPFSTPINNHFVYLFFRFCAERHRMQERREAGVPKGELSEDETMTKMFVGNVFRELDRGSLRMTDEIMAEGDQSIEEVCCKFTHLNSFFLSSYAPSLSGPSLSCSLLPCDAM